jgi:hypothetical protein
LTTIPLPPIAPHVTKVTSRLLLEVTTDGVVEVDYAVEHDLNALGWIRAEQMSDLVTAVANEGQEQLNAMAIGMGAALRAEQMVNGHAVKVGETDGGEALCATSANPAPAPHSSCACASPKFEQRGFVQWCAACDRPKHWSPEPHGERAHVANVRGVTVPEEPHDLSYAEARDLLLKNAGKKLPSEQAKDLLLDKGFRLAADAERSPMIQAILDVLDQRLGRG